MFFDQGIEARMKIGMRAAAVGIATAAMLGVGVLPAAAAGPTSCPSSGNIDSWSKCSSLGNGVLYISTTKTGNYVLVNYYRASGSALTAKLGWERGGVNNWWANRDMSTVPLHYSKQAGISASCAVIIGKLLTTGGSSYATPPVDPC
ncbi:hypothetical protein ACFXHD_23100 [Streptomyces hydrogenans]|uniref:hypothetical protein n=1 Tax=Streptomyces hydrogenans TaxID=1873719 RepID=UPI00368ACF5E